MENNYKTILVTGGAGFLGSNVVRLLLDNNFNVIILKRKESDLSKISNFINNKLIFYNSDENELEKIFSENNVDFIIHLATCYGRNSETISEILDTNLMLPLKLLEIGSKFNVKGFINADTFFNEKIVFEKEENFYVSSKKYFLKTANEIIKKNDIKFVNMLIQHMYGPDDSLEKFIPSVICDMLLKKKFIKFTPGEQERDFVFVEDVALAFLSVVNNFDNLDKKEIFDIGLGQSFSIKYLVEKIKSVLDSETTLEWGKLKYRDNEIMKSEANILINNKINWMATTDLINGLKQTIDYYRSDINNFCKDE